MRRNNLSRSSSQVALLVVVALALGACADQPDNGLSWSQVLAISLQGAFPAPPPYVPLASPALRCDSYSLGGHVYTNCR